MAFEVILADGRLATASATSNRDLWIALKGGGNSFGIVTKFTMKTFVQGKLWGGFRYHLPYVAPQLIKAYHEFANEKTHDKLASCILAMGYDSFASWLAPIPGSLLQYQRPVNDAPAFKSFMAVRYFWSTLKTCTLSQVTKETSDLCPPGFR